MSASKVVAAVEKLVAAHPGRPKDAYLTVFEAIERVFMKTGTRVVASVEPQDLFHAYAAELVVTYGFLASEVARHWTIGTPDDLWEVCLRLNEHGLLVFLATVEDEKLKFDKVGPCRNMLALCDATFERMLTTDPPKILGVA